MLEKVLRLIKTQQIPKHLCSWLLFCALCITFKQGNLTLNEENAMQLMLICKQKK